MDPRRLILIWALLLATPSLFAQLSFDNFDSYAAGSSIAGQGDWVTWDNNPAVDAVVSNAFSNSPPNSLQLQPNDDIVRLFAGINTGSFTLTSMVYTPSGQNGVYYFILMNTYSAGGPYNWSAQIQISDALGMVTDQGGSGAVTGLSTPTAIVYDTWVQVRVDVDLTANTYDARYNNVLIMQGNTWSGAASQLAAIDLYNDGGGTFYYDDVSVDCAGGCGGCLPFDSMACDINCATNEVTLDWTTFQVGGYAAGITIERNGTPIATLLGSETTYTDPAAPLGLNNYEVIGDCGTGTTWSALCSVACTGACPPAVLGDECCDAQVAVTGANAFDTTGGTESPDPYDGATCTGTFLGDMISDTWLTYTATSDGFARFDTCNTFDTDLVIYEGSDCATKVEIGCSGDACGLSSDVTVAVTTGTTYLVRIGLWDAAVTGGVGTLNITELCEPSFDSVSSLLDCNSGDVTLQWTAGTWDSFEVVRDGLSIATLPAGTSSYVDPALFAGNYVYDVTATCLNGSALTDTLDVAVSGQLGTTDLIMRGEDAFAGQVNSAEALEAALIANGLNPILLDGGPEDIACVDDATLERVWVMNGTFGAARVVTAADAAQLILLQSLGKSIYFESGDAWGFDPPTAFNDIDGVADGTPDGNDSFLSMTGADSGFGLDTSGSIGVVYGQDAAGNDWTDQIDPSTTDTLGPDSAVIWSEAGGTYNTGIYYSTNAGGKLICQSWEFGGFGLDPFDPAASNSLRNDLAALYVAALSAGPPPGQEFIRGDSNRDGGVNIADAIFVLGVLFPGAGGANMLTCEDSADVNDDGTVNIADAIFLLGNLFPGAGGPPGIPAPNPACGQDPVGPTGPDAIDCAAYANCP